MATVSFVQVVCQSLALIPCEPALNEGDDVVRRRDVVTFKFINDPLAHLGCQDALELRDGVDVAHPGPVLQEELVPIVEPGLQVFVTSDGSNLLNLITTCFLHKHIGPSLCSRRMKCGTGIEGNGLELWIKLHEQ